MSTAQHCPWFNSTSASLRGAHCHPEPHPFMVVLAHSSLCHLPPLHVTDYAHARAHTHTPHKFTLLWTSQPQAQTTPQQGHHGTGSPLPPPSPGHSKRYFQTGALPVPSKQWNTEGPQDGLKFSLCSLEPLPQTLRRSCWHSVAQENVTWPGRQKTWVLVCPCLARFLTLGKSASLSSLGCLKSLN